MDAHARQAYLRGFVTGMGVAYESTISQWLPIRPMGTLIAYRWPMIPQFPDRNVFGKRLNTVVSPARPIQSIEHLVWRTEELERIQKALFMTGRHIFIYGDRGVGKSSLAATAAAQLQSADAEPISVACVQEASLESVIANIAYAALKSSRLHKTKQSQRSAVELKYLKFDNVREMTLNDLQSEIRSGLDAVEILREAMTLHSEHPVVVIDEFDRMKEMRERERFGDLVKQLGDRGIDIRIIFTGVGRSLQDLLGAHASSIRQLDTILLPTLPWEGRYEIVRNAVKAFALSVNHEILVRIAAISDGYPSYVHKITEKILWHMFDDPKRVTDVAWSHFNAAVNDAVSESYATFSELYGIAVNQRSDDYEEVLWATADSEYLQRYINDMYSSYEYIMKARKADRTPLDGEKFASRIRNLKTKSCGEILMSVKGKRGMYQYRENMFRGYVRMQAEAHGIELVGKGRESGAKQVIHVPASANRGYYASKPPTGVHLERKRRNGDRNRG